MKPHRSVNALVVLALVLSAVTTTGYSPLLSSLIGRWQAIDPADGSDMSLVVGGPPGGPFNITWTEDYLSLCGGE
ncbi:MAG TPA: hypothetical protein VFI11_09125, partial [Anaerolineales bacterium]|nr:hypothetical protein [Anaerolineales bacterium]